MSKFEKVVEAYEAGASKNEVKEALYKEGVPFSQLDKKVKELGFSWRGRGRGWREASVDAFKENPELTLDAYIELLRECKQAQPEVKGKYFYPMLSALAK